MVTRKKTPSKKTVEKDYIDGQIDGIKRMTGKKKAAKPVKKTTKPRKKKTSVNQILIDSPSILAVNPIHPEPTILNPGRVAYNPDRPALEPVFVTQVADLAQTEVTNIPSATYQLLKADAPALPEVIAELKKYKEVTDSIDLEWSDIDPDAPRPTFWMKTKRFFRELFGR